MIRARNIPKQQEVDEDLKKKTHEWVKILTKTQKLAGLKLM